MTGWGRLILNFPTKDCHPERQRRIFPALRLAASSPNVGFRKPVWNTKKSFAGALDENFGRKLFLKKQRFSFTSLSAPPSLKRETKQRILTDIGFRLAALRQQLRDTNTLLTDSERNAILDTISRLVKLRVLIEAEEPED
jgi:hypothetical protein